jgi:hypothetical protein
MKLKHVGFPLLIATLSLQAQTVSSISTGHPGSAIIEGNIVDEGKSFTFKGATYTVKKIAEAKVTAVSPTGEEILLSIGPNTNYIPSKPAVPASPQLKKVLDMIEAAELVKRENSKPIELSEEDRKQHLLRLEKGKAGVGTLWTLIKGRSAEEVEALLGPPDRTQDEKGGIVWLYYNLTYDFDAKRKDQITFVKFKGSGDARRVEDVDRL